MYEDGVLSFEVKSLHAGRDGCYVGYLDGCPSVEGYVRCECLRGPSMIVDLNGVEVGAYGVGYLTAARHKGAPKFCCTVFRQRHAKIYTD
jgi:hypothetical protein